MGPLLGSSWLWSLALALLALWVAPVAWGYWLTRNGPGIPRRRARRLLDGTTAVALVAVAIGVGGALREPEPNAAAAFWATVALSAAGALVAYALALWRNSRDEATQLVDRPGSDDAAALEQENRVRTKLSRWLLRATQGVLLTAAVALADDLGRGLYYYAIGALPNGSGGAGAAFFGAGWIVVLPVVRWALKRVGSAKLLDWPGLSSLLRRFSGAASLALGLLLLATVASAWSAVAYALVWQGSAIPGDGPMSVCGSRPGQGWIAPLAMGATTAAIALALGRFHGFLNQSSLSFFYASRLRKAYLGASNVERISAATPPDVELASDEIELAAYHHEAVLAPVHLVNATINETTSRSSRIVQRDRKGKSLCVSPAGYVFTRRAPGEAPVAFPLSVGEQLPVSTWMGISGAAFSTGMGQFSSTGLSLLAGLTNLRLGYWWDSPIPGRTTAHRALSQAFRQAKRESRIGAAIDDLVQSYLLRELRGAYEGTHSNRWYLTDGGHYENTGAYELLRRRIPFVLLCDNGADPGYAFSDLVNLIRKARIDFEAETEFLGPAELDTLLGPDGALRHAFGTLEELATGFGTGGHRAGPYAALARVRYLATDDVTAKTPPTTLILIKPRLAGDETPDLLSYREANAAFPQQPTTDQSFDEAQWESYYRLGQLLGDAIFADPPAARDPLDWRPWKGTPRRWRPRDLAPLP